MNSYYFVRIFIRKNGLVDYKNWLEDCREIQYCTTEYFKDMEYGLGLQFEIEFIIVLGTVLYTKISLNMCSDTEDILIYM